MLFNTYIKTRVDAEEIDCGGELSERTLEETVEALEIPQEDKAHEADLEAVDMRDKLSINNLGESTQKQLQECVVQFNQVQEFIRGRDRCEPGFHDQLRNFFRREYKKVVLDSQTRGDELFEALIDSLKKRIPNSSRLQKLAIPPIVTYLFIVCDLFQRTSEGH